MSYDKGVDAIILAGGTQLSFWRKAGYILIHLEDLFNYGHTHISESSYKSLIGFAGEIDGKRKIRPLVEYTLHNLQNTERVKKIYLVGPKKELEQGLQDVVCKYNKLEEIVDQTNNLGGNVKRGYDAAGGTGHKLFHVCDTPGSKEKNINEFLNITKEYVDNYQLIYPIVPKQVIEQIKQAKIIKKKFYFKLIPDNINDIKTHSTPHLDKKGRQGFRISSMALADLEGIMPGTIEEAYQSRKMMRRSVRKRLKRLFGGSILKAYRKGLKLSEIENLVKESILNYQDNIEDFPMKIVQLSIPGTTLDIDSKPDLKELEKLDY